MSAHLRSITLAFASSVLTFAFTFIAGLAWLLFSASKRAGEQAGVGLDVPTFAKHISIPASVLVFIVVLLVLAYRNK